MKKMDRSRHAWFRRGKIRFVKLLDKNYKQQDIPIVTVLLDVDTIIQMISIDEASQLFISVLYTAC